jgi:hypothetical protein
VSLRIAGYRQTRSDEVGGGLNFARKKSCEIMDAVERHAVVAEKSLSRSFSGPAINPTVTDQTRR